MKVWFLLIASINASGEFDKPEVFGPMTLLECRAQAPQMEHSLNTADLPPLVLWYVATCVSKAAGDAILENTDSK